MQARAGAALTGWGKVLLCPSCSVPLQRHPARELVVQATTVFGNLQSFVKQALDQAVATQAVWHTLSSRPRVRARPERWAGRGSRRVARAACWVPQLPRVEGGWWLDQEAVRSPFLAVLTCLFAEDLLGQAVSWPWGRAVSGADPLSWDVTRCPHVPAHCGMYCPCWGGRPGAQHRESGDQVKGTRIARERWASRKPGWAWVGLA